MNISRIKSIVIIIISCIVMVGSVIGFLYTLGIVSSNIATATKQAGGSSSSQVARLQALQKESRSISNDVIALTSKTLTKEAIPTLLDTLESLSVGGTHPTIRDLTTIEQEGLVRISLAYIGSLDESLQLVQSLSKVPHIAYIDSLDMQKAEDADSGDWVVSVFIALPLLPKNTINP